MPTFQIGRKEFTYDLRRSAAASERRITITPGHIEVLALQEDGDSEVADFLTRKRQWLFDTVREMERATASRHAVPRFATGSKIPYRGRRMPLTVRRTDADRATVSYRNGFVVDLPHWVEGDPDHLVASELKHWLKQRARLDVHDVVHAYRRRFGLEPRTVRVADLAQGWGSCGAEGNILVNWHLVFAPTKVLEYVVVHELAHLRHRSHAAEFWAFVQTMLPDFSTAKGWLDNHQTELSADFLNPCSAS